MIPITHSWMVLTLSSAFLIVLIGLPQIQSSQTPLLADIEDDASDLNDLTKRGWKDMSGSWGKRGWNDLQGAWGKRAWERLNGAWGKRLTFNPEPEWDEFPSEISKRPEWGKFKGSWGKRASGGSSAGWNNLKGLWGKRAWDKFGNSWGKRSLDNNNVAAVPPQPPSESSQNDFNNN